MDFSGTGLAEETYDLSACCSSYDRVIDQDDPFAAHHILYRVQLQMDSIRSFFLFRGNKGPADILIFNKTDPVRNA